MFLSQVRRYPRSSPEKELTNLVTGVQSFWFCLLGCSLGLATPSLFRLLGVSTGEQAIHYYAEVHQSRWNSWIHSLGMPFAYYGMLLWFPLLFGLEKKQTALLQLFFYSYYSSYYLTFHIPLGLLVALSYLPSQICAMRFYLTSDWSRVQTMTYGFLVAFLALSFQEYFGHYLGGDPPSRLEAVPNAIWHAAYYSIWHLIYG